MATKEQIRRIFFEAFDNEKAEALLATHEQKRKDSEERKRQLWDAATIKAYETLRGHDLMADTGEKVKFLINEQPTDIKSLAIHYYADWLADSYGITYDEWSEEIESKKDAQAKQKNIALEGHTGA